MKPLNKRLTAFLIDILVREKTEEAWEQLKKLELEGSDLISIILGSPFQEEAWELLKQKGEKPDFLELMENGIGEALMQEVESILLDNYELTREELIRLLRHAKSDRAAKILLDQDPTRDELHDIMQYSNLADDAAQILMTGNPDKDDLYEIMDYSSFKLEAWERFIQLSPTMDEIISIICFTDLEEIAWKYFLDQNPKDKHFMDFVNDYSETGRKQKEAARILLDRKTKKKHLLDLIRMDVFKEEAWELLMRKKPKYKHLYNFLRYENYKVDEIGAYCLTLKPEKGMLMDVVAHSNKNDEAAALLLKMPLELHELADIIVHSTIEPVLNAVSERVQFDRTAVNEQELIREITSKILADPDLLDVNNWHNEGKHCVGGWAISLVEAAQHVEKEFSSEIAACLLLPNYKHIFFADRETVLGELREVLEAGN